MLPEKIVRFLERANVAYAGTRDANLVPHGHHVSGWTVGANAQTITALIPAASTPHLVDSLLDNGQFSMTTEEYPAHEAYQFKGNYVRHRAVLPDEIVHDLPGGEWRRVQRARGYRYVLVNGEVTIRDDQQTGTCSGQLLRHGVGRRTPMPRAA